MIRVVYTQVISAEKKNVPIHYCNANFIFILFVS